MIAPSPHDAGTAFIVFDNHRRSDMETYVYRVNDYGRNWNNLAGNTLSGYALSVLQDHVDPDLLFLGTEFGLFVSTNGGGDWVKFTVGVPTVSVMDMAIQQREDDLVLGTHGRSIYVIDDYSALRGLTEKAFDTRLAILDTSDGQQYVASQTPSTRFTGSGEFRAVNEPYGVMISFIASGDDLPHPNSSEERERSIRQRASQSADDETGDDKAPKVEMTVRNTGGEVIRKYKYKVHQGLNRVVWSMEGDGIRPMPGPDKADLEDGLPAGLEVLPGAYQVTLSLASGSGEPAISSAPVTVLQDPRSGLSAQEQQSNYQTLLSLEKMQAEAVLAVERIVNAHAGVSTALQLIRQKQEPGMELDKDLKALMDQGEEVQEGLLELEKRFRTPPQTRGIVYDDDKVSAKIGLAQYYVGSTKAAPTATAMTYVQQARSALTPAVEAVDRFMTRELEMFSQSLSDAGIGLFGGAIQP